MRLPRLRHMKFLSDRLGTFAFSAFAVVLVLMISLAASAQSAVPRFERSECTFVPPPQTASLRPECGYLVVPQVRGKPQGRTLRLAVVIYRAKEPSNALPLLLLHGGPGGEGGIRNPWPPLLSPLTRNRDMVIFDVRGSGLSEPQLCPGFYESTSPVFNRRSRQEREQGYNEAVRACAERLKAEGIEPSAYSTAINAADAIDLRRTLGYTRWDVYGVSYGTHLARELMRKDAAAIHAVVLVSPGSWSGAEAAQDAFTQQRALERVFAACATQPACHAAFPTLEKDSYEVYEELSQRPLEVHINSSGNPTTVWLDGERFLREIPHQLVSFRAVALPLLINELRRGDRSGAARQLLGSGMMGPWYPLGHLVNCNDYGAAYPASVVALKSKLRPAFRTIADDIREHCDGWLQQLPRNNQPRLVSGIPTLILNGEIDPHGGDLRTSELVTGLKHAYVYEVRGRGHESLGSCSDSVVERFIEDPTRVPDASCLTNVQQIAFATQKPNPTTLVFFITSTIETPTQFAGEWKVELQFPGQPLIFELKTDGSTLTGVLQPPRAGLQPIEIFDGKIDGNTMTFKFKSPDGQRTITLIGTLSADEIAFRREVEGPAPGGRPGISLFGPAGPQTFTAKRKSKGPDEK
ncbi:MAG TPA: alpha/beta hydrolase [Pyrinomonadaceae bacterium]|nr:alpha/beta hydrolase [Pyrinomonadaceae bacterium]